MWLLEAGAVLCVPEILAGHHMSLNHFKHKTKAMSDLISLLTANIKRKRVHIRSQRQGTFRLRDVWHHANTIYTAFSGVYGTPTPVFPTDHTES